MSTYLAILGPLGWQEILLILLIGLLLFGARLPEVGRSLGRSLLEFKKGLRGIQDGMNEVEREADRRVDEELERRRVTAATEARALEVERGHLRETLEPTEEVSSQIEPRREDPLPPG